MNRRNLLKIVPAGLLAAGGFIGFNKLFAGQKEAVNSKASAETTVKKMITIEELNALERNPETITPIELTKKDWNEVLNPNQYAVLREEATERPGSSPLDAEKRVGQFICAGCGLALFDSQTKFDSGTGWPSFFDFIKGNIATKTDWKIGYPRTEYHCARCGGHQGHVFKDGPKPTGLRYCNNGLAIEFIPKDPIS